MRKYSVIYADPPWRYKNYNYSETKSGERAKRGQEKEYLTMTIDDIKNLPIADISEKDCILFIWVTFPLLQEGLDVIKSWGFKYKTIGFNWVKKNKKQDSLFWGMGNWTRSNSELCLIGIKGDPKRISASVHSVVVESEDVANSSSVIVSPIEKHSQKPAEIRNKIVQLCGDLPRVELFARQKVDGWDICGNELENDIDLG